MWEERDALFPPPVVAKSKDDPDLPIKTDRFAKPVNRRGIWTASIVFEQLQISLGQSTMKESTMTIT